MDVEAVFLRRLKEIVLEKHGSYDRFYLETGFSKGHLTQIIRGVRSPSISTLVKLAKLLEVELVLDLTSPEKIKKS